MRTLPLLGALLLTACFNAVNEPSPVTGGGGGSAGGAAGGSGGGAASDCSTDADCPRGMVCERCGALEQCVPGCRTDAECARPTTCQTNVQCKTCPCPPGFCAIDPCLDVDGDGFVAGFGSTCSGKRGGDCNDTSAAVSPAASERCGNGVDDDCDGLTDGDDPQCKTCSGGGAGCSTVWDCNLGQTFCEKRGGVSACCTSCPQFVGDCVQGFSPRPHGIDPLTGCDQVACVTTSIACPASWEPVCGMNGQTYGNGCELARAQVELLHDGPCVRGENLECGVNGPAACGTSGALYCRDACPVCDAWVMRCTKVGVCVNDLDCPAGSPPPPALCPDGGVPRASCVSRACQWSC